MGNTVNLLPQAILPLTGTELLYADQGGIDTQLTPAAIAALNNPAIAALAVKIARTASVIDFGADPTGVLDSTAAVQSAVNASGNGSGVIYFPQGVYVISSVTVNASVIFQGAGPTASVIKPKNPTSNVFDVLTSDVIFQDLAWNFGPTQTGGAYINLDSGSSLCTVDNCYMLGWFNGLQLNGGGTYTIRDTVFTNGVATNGTAINVIGAVGGLLTLDNVVVTNPSGVGQQPFAGLYFNGGGNVNINVINSQFIQCIHGAALQPGVGQVIADAQFVNCYFDHAVTHGCLLDPTASNGAIVRTVFDTCWFGSTTSGIGLLATTGTGGSIDGVTLNNCNAALNNAQGVWFSGSNTQNVQITAGFYAGNGAAGIVFDAAATTGMSVNGAHCGPWGSVSGNGTYGVQILSGTANNFTIANCDLRGNTTAAIGDASTGTGRLKVNNKGYNPIGTASVSYPGTGTAYTAGDTPETIFMTGGTVTVISVNGTSVMTGANVSPAVVPLNPGETLTCTSSSNPTFVANRQ